MDKMKALAKVIWLWLCNKFGRIVTFFGAVVASLEAFDVSVIRDPLADLFGTRSSKFVSGTALLCLLLSFMRHSWVASQHPPDNGNNTMPKSLLAGILLAALSMLALHTIRAAEVPVELNAPKVEGHPVTSIVVTQCNLIVVVYLTFPDGRLVRFDRDSQLEYDQLMMMAYSATRSERVEVSCNEEGVVGYEKHEPL